MPIFHIIGTHVPQVNYSHVYVTANDEEVARMVYACKTGGNLKEIEEIKELPSTDPWGNKPLVVKE